MGAAEHIELLRDMRSRVWEESKRWLETIHAEKRDMTGEESAQWNRYNQRLDELEVEIKATLTREQNERDAAVSYEAMGREFGAAGVQNREQQAQAEFRSWINGETELTYRDEHGKLQKGLQVDLAAAQREANLIRAGASADEVRALAWDTGSIASGVPTTLARTLYQYVTAPVAMMNMPTYQFTTTSGEQMKFPRVNAHGIATQVSGQGTAMAGTDPTFLSMTLDAYKYAELVKVANEVLTDTAFDVVGFLGSNIGRAVGQVIATDLVTGSGSGKPNGIMTAITGAGTIASGGTSASGVLTFEKLLDLNYSVNAAYAQRNTVAWLFNRLTVAQIRKVRDGAGGTTGGFIWDGSNAAAPGVQGAEPGGLLGYPVWTDPNVASMASNAVVGAFGAWDAYYIRTVGNFVIERDDSRYFDTDEVGFRGKWRVDGDVIDTTAINIIKNSVS